ncbi:MAG: hypothetical protein V3S55_12460 [Nitrospiraceae bacterium]
MGPDDQHHDPAPSGSPGPEVPTPTPARGSESDEGHQLHVPGMMLGTALMFIGFLNVLLSLGGGFEINVTPLVLYCAGVALWAHSVLEQPAVRYTVIAGAVVVGLAFYYYGEVHFWHKQVVFWTTVLLVSFFMFKSSKPK